MPWTADDEEIFGVIDANLKSSPPSPPSVNTSVTVKNLFKAFWGVASKQMKSAVDYVDLTNSSVFIQASIAQANQAVVDAETKRAQTEALKNEAKLMLDNAVLADHPLGEYNPVSNFPALTATPPAANPPAPAIGVPIGSYYTITESGTLSFAGSNFVVNAAVTAGGRLVKKSETQWFYSKPSDAGFTKASAVESMLITRENVGASNLVPTNSISVINRIGFNRVKYVTIAGKVETIKAHFYNKAGTLGFYVLRKVGAEYIEVSRNNITGVLGLNEINVSALNIAVLPGDIFGLQCLEDVNARPGTQTSSGSGVYGFTPVVPGDPVKINAVNIDVASGVGEVCFTVTVKADFTETTKTKLSAHDAKFVTDQANITANTLAITNLNLLTTDIKASVISYQNQALFTTAPKNDNGWNINTFGGWVVGYIPTQVKRWSQVKFRLGQVGTNEKIRLSIYRRPVAEATSAAVAGSGANDVLIETKDFLTSAYAAGTAFQDITFDFTKFDCSTAFIYFFRISGVLAGGGLGPLGIDRADVAPNTLQAYERGWYMNLPAGTFSAIGAASAFRIALTIYSEVLIDNVAAHSIKLTAIESDLKLGVRKSLNLGTKLYTDALSLVSTDYVNVGWSLVAGGVSPGANVGFSNCLHLNRQYNASKRKCTVRATFGADTRFMMFTKAIEGNVNLGTIVECDVAAGKIRIYKAYADAGVLPTVQIEAVYAFVSGREYQIEFLKDDFNNGIRVTDTISGLYTELTDSSNLSGRQHDSYAFCNYSGAAPVIRKLYISTPYEVGCYWYHFGDSISEARYSPLVLGDGFAFKFLNAIGGKGGVSGRGGGNINGVLRRIETELAFIKPVYTSVMIGTNSGNTLANLTQMCNRIIEIGSIPILHNVPVEANGAENSVSNPVIEQVRANFGIQGCKFDIATSINYDLAQGQNQALFNSDSGAWVHPNAAGMQKMFERFNIDTDLLR